MLRCRITAFLVSALPIRPLQGLMIRVHADRCPNCRDGLAGRDEVRRLLVQQREGGEPSLLWAALEPRLSGRAAARSLPFWRRHPLASSAASALAVLAALILVFKPSFRAAKTADLSILNVFQIRSISIDDQPADAYLFCPQDSDMIIVWAEKKI